MNKYKRSGKPATFILAEDLANCLRYTNLTAFSYMSCQLGSKPAV